MLQSSGKLRKSIRVEPSIYQAWVPPFFSEKNDEDKINISLNRGECVFEPNVFGNGESGKKAEDTIKNLKYLLRNMETDFNCLSGERLMEYISDNFRSKSPLIQDELSAEKLLLSTVNYSSTRDNRLINQSRNSEKSEFKVSEFCLSVNNDCFERLSNYDQILEEIEDRGYEKLSSSSYPVTYGKYWEITLNQQFFLSLIDNWRREVGIILNETYKEGRYTLEEGKELLKEGLILQRRVKLPEFILLTQAVKRASDFEERVKEALSISNKELNLDLQEIRPANKIQIRELQEFLNEGEKCLFYSKCLDLLKFQLEKLKSWRKTVQSALIEKNLDKCKDSMKDKDEIFIEVPGTDDLTEQIAASNWIEKVERSLSRPMRLNFAESLLNEPAAKFLDEKDILVKKQLTERVNKALDWLKVVQSPPFVFNLVSACKDIPKNDIPESLHIVIDDAKKLMETTNDWKLPDPLDFEKIWLESLTLKVNVPVSRFMEPVYLRWKKWHKKFKRLMDGLCIYMEAQLILEEAEYTLCDFLDMSEYLPILKAKINESSDWLNESREFLRNVSEYNTKQDIDDVSSSVWSTITGMKKGNEFTKLELQEVIKFIENQIDERRLSYDKLKKLINKGNELTIYDTSILQELSSCFDSCERWLKKGKELIKSSKNSSPNISSIVSLLIERSSILVSSETEEYLFAELKFLLWKLDIKDIQAPINDIELLSLIERLNSFKSHISIYPPGLETQNKTPDSKNLITDDKNKLIAIELDGGQKNEIQDDVDINLLTPRQINSSHWEKLRQLEPIMFVKKLEQIYEYWNSVALSYERSKSKINCWKNLLVELSFLPIKLSKLEDKTKEIIEEYERISLLLSSGNKELMEETKMDHPFSLLFSYKKLIQLNDDVSRIPVEIENWNRWLRHIEDLNNSDKYTLECFPHLLDSTSENISNRDSVIPQVEMNSVAKHIDSLNEKLISTSVWNIKDFKRIFCDLKYTGRLLDDLESCKKWIEDIKIPRNGASMNLDYWKELLEEGKKLSIVDYKFLSDFESELNISIEWDKIYRVVTSDTVNKHVKTKKIKLSSKKIPYYFAKLLVGDDYGIGERLTTFKELRESVESYISLRERGIKYLEMSHNDRIKSRFSEVLDKSSIEQIHYEYDKSIAIDEIKKLNQFTYDLKEFHAECLKHPILIEFTNFIQDEILLRDLNQKLINTLITGECCHLLSLNNKSPTLLEPIVRDIKEAVELINYIEDNDLYSETYPNIQIKSESDVFSIKITNETENKRTYLLEELEEIIFSEDTVLHKDIIFGDSFLSKKYVDSKLFNLFKNSVKKTKQWLNLFNSFGFNIVNNSKIEYYYNKQIPSNLFPKSFKSSIDLLIGEYVESFEYAEFRCNNSDNSYFNFKLDWDRILEPYLKMDYSKIIDRKNKVLINHLLRIFNPNLVELLDFHEINEDSSKDYSVYNVSLLSNLLHYMRERKECINSRGYGQDNYYEINSVVKSMINDRYFSYLPVDGGNDFEQLENMLNQMIVDVDIEVSKDLSNIQLESSHLSNQSSQKRAKRNKAVLDERVNENNIDGILNIVRKLELPTIDMSLLLLSFAIKYIKFDLIEIKNLSVTIEFIFLWIFLINNKFPNIFSPSNGLELDSKNSAYDSETMNSFSELEIWENLISFRFCNGEGSNIDGLDYKYDSKHKNLSKDLEHRITLREFILLIEICDQMPIQIPIKTRLVINLISILKWALSAREAIFLLPRNTILRPWSHINGVCEEIKVNKKFCKIIDDVRSEEKEYKITDEDIRRIISNICSHDSENHAKTDKTTETDQLAKKTPRPRGRPKREIINSNRSEITSDEIYNSVCSEYKEFDKLSNGFPISFYSWLKEVDEDLIPDDFLLQTKGEEKKNLKYGWINGYFYWYNKGTVDKTELNESSSDLIQRIGMLDPDLYPKKEIYRNKLIIDFIISIELFISIENTPADLCAICSTFNNYHCFKNDSPNFNPHLSWISCDECNRWYHKECVYQNQSSNHNRKNFCFQKNVYGSMPWICQLCDLRSKTSSIQSETIISQLKMNNNFSLYYNNNKYIIPQIQGKSKLNNQNLSPMYNNLLREIYPQESLKELLFFSLSGPISHIQLYERNVIYNKFYLLNVWINDFYDKFRWDVLTNSTYDLSIFNMENATEDNTDLEDKTSTTVKNELSEESVEMITVENDINKAISDQENMSTSRKGRIIKNKISIKEMLNPKISVIKARKCCKKRRLLIPTYSVNKQIKKIYNSNLKNHSSTVQVNFRLVFSDFNFESKFIDPDTIGKLRKLDHEKKLLNISDITNSYFLGMLIGVDQIAEIEWLYCILIYLIYFNNLFNNFNKNLESLKAASLPKDLTFSDSLELEKRLKFEKFKYILRFFSPNFPIKLASSKIFYSGILSVKSNYLSCKSILRQFNQLNYGFTKANDKESIKNEFDSQVIKIDDKNFKSNLELLLDNIIKSGIIFPEEKVICQILRIYYLESVLMLVRRQITNFYNNQLNQKPIFSCISSIYDHIQIWKENDTYLFDEYKVRFLPPEMNNKVSGDENDNGRITRFQLLLNNCDLIKDIVDQCNEWNENYNLLKNSDEFGIFVELLKKGLNLPCIYPPVYSFGNVLASIESYEDFVDQVFDHFVEEKPSSVQFYRSGGQHTYPNSSNAISSNKLSTPKFENAQVLKSIKEFLSGLPIQKKDLNLKIEKMEKNVNKFIEDIKIEIPMLKQITSTESLISKLQTIKDEAIFNVPIIVTNLPELRELLNSLPDFGSPHHNLLVRTQFLMSLQSPVAKLRKPLSPFPNISDPLGNPEIHLNSSETTIPETRKDSVETIENPDKKKTHILENLITNSSQQFPAEKTLMWQNVINKGIHQVNHCYYK